MHSDGHFTPILKRLVDESYGECRTCGASLVPGSPAFAGYDEKDRPLYVGECCLKKVTKLASHVYWSEKPDRRPQPSATIWRYIDFSKFVSLIATRSLYFARADKLGDEFEGASGIEERREEWETFYLRFFRRTTENLPGEVPAAFTEEAIEKQGRELIEQLHKTAAEDRHRTFVSCWHQNSGESEALWRLYCPPGSAGLAIQTDVSHLRDCLRDVSDLSVGQVQYVDFKTRFAPINDRVFWKRKSLSHESEVRAVIRIGMPEGTNGLAIPVDPTRLVNKLVPSPFAPEWFSSTIQAVLERFEVPLRVAPSELQARPFF